MNKKIVVPTLAIFILSFGFLLGSFFSQKATCNQEITIQKELLLQDLDNKLSQIPELIGLYQKNDETHFIGRITEKKQDLLIVRKENLDLKTLLNNNETLFPVKISPETKIFYYQNSFDPINNNWFFEEKILFNQNLEVGDQVEINFLPSENSAFLIAKTIKTVK